MIKMLTREYLSTYIYLESEIKRMRGRIKYYNDHPVTCNYGVVKGSMAQFPYTQCHFVVSGPSIKSTEERDKAIRQLVIDLKGNERLFEDMKLDIELFLEKLPVEMAETKHILALKYVDRLSEEEISRKIHLSRRTVNRRINDFFDMKYTVSA